MDAHTSVASTSASAQAASGSVGTVDRAPVCPAMAGGGEHRRVGRYRSGAPIRTRIPAVAPPSR